MVRMPGGLTPAAYANRMAQIGYPDPGLWTAPLWNAGDVAGSAT